MLNMERRGLYLFCTYLALLTLFTWVPAKDSFAQDLRPLSAAVQERIDRLEELVQYYTNQSDLRLATTYLNQISYLYWENNRHDKAAESFYRAAGYYETLNDFENLHKIFSNIGLIYLDLENIPEADKAFIKNLQVQRKSGNRQGIASALADLAYVKNLRNDHREAIKLLEEALQLAQEINYESILPNIHRQLSNSYNSIGNVRQAEEHIKKHNDIKEYLSRQNLRGEYLVREEQSQVEILRQQAEARVRQLEMETNRIRYQLEQDSISMVVKEQEESLIQARRIERIQRQDIELLEKQNQLNEVEMERQEALQKQQQTVIYSGLGGLILLLFVAIIMYRSNKAKRKANILLAAKNLQIQQASEELKQAFVKIEDQNYRITQSISYASEIQKALLPPDDTLSTFLPDSFVFFKPVDVVSGDFYWFKEALLNKDEAVEVSMIASSPHDHPVNLPGAMVHGGQKFSFDGKLIITAVDCTGHGVPGAFMSMIGYNLLDSITSSGITQPDQILGKLNEGIRATLKQNESSNRDGMDVSLCVINKATQTVEFAGANNPVIYISDGKLNMIKGDTMPVGGNHKKGERVYTSHTIQTDQPTSFYILTDGFTDQFGGPEGRKFSIKQFKELLLQIYTFPMAEQKALLDIKLKEWMGDEEQIDDILVIGFRI
jgi:serine phosphatase RsbU (regulator of sigma subunit)